MFKSSNILPAILFTALGMPIYLISPPESYTNAMLRLGDTGELNAETVLPILRSFALFGLIFTTFLFAGFIRDNYEAKKEKERSDTRVK